MRFMTERERRLPVSGEYQVIVCGAGPAGISAALSAARQGMRTLLIEAGGCLGGVWTSGLLSIILDVEGKAGIMGEISQHLNQAGACRERRPGSANYTYDVETMKELLERLCTNAGVDILLHTRLTHAIVQERLIQAVVTESYSGREAFTAKVFIDCTGNGELAEYAGCQYTIGHPHNGQTQPASLHAVISGIPSDFQGTVNHNDKRKFRDFMRSMGVDPSYQLPTVARLPGADAAVFCINHEYGIRCDSTRDITQATIRARSEIHQAIQSLKKAEGWENLRIVATADQIGLREGRRVHGLYTVTSQDITDGARFDDGICLVRFAVDVHTLDRESGGGYGREGLVVKPYHMPLRSLISVDLLNMAMAGRNVSGDFFAHASYRVTGNSVPMGEAAGLAASLAIRNNQNLHEIRGAAIRETMKKRGYAL